MPNVRHAIAHQLPWRSHSGICRRWPNASGQWAGLVCAVQSQKGEFMKSVLRVPRRWHEEAMRRLEEYLAQGGTKPLLAACTASGKTEFAIRDACNFFNNEGGQLILVVAPTVNVKLRWVTDFRNAGFLATADIENREIRQRLEHGEPIKEDVEVIAVTYGQLASPQAMTTDGWSLFAEYARRYRTLVIADEVHHADDDEAYGQALTAVTAHATRRLALSGTPFNSTGGALAMCDVDIDVDTTGRPIRRVKPFYTYSYGDALGDEDRPCRLVEFG